MIGYITQNENHGTIISKNLEHKSDKNHNPAPNLKGIHDLNFFHPLVILATWGGSGFLRPASGTWGTLFGLPVGVLIQLTFGPIALFIAMAAIFSLGWVAAKWVEKMTEDPDSSLIVIDEVAGIWVTLLFCGPFIIHWILAFFIFRFFDIIKIWPANWLDNLKKPGFSVMADDVIAGLYAGITVYLIDYFNILSLMPI
jgi:phosphatidylglycerophosphatase A